MQINLDKYCHTITVVVDINGYNTAFTSNFKNEQKLT